ncbi:ImmA/IrrE family metallo-endopeptidase [Kocuria himachalensis]
MSVRVPIVGETLAWAREVLGVDVDDLGRTAGVTGEQVSRFENEEVQPTLPQLRKIAKKLDRSPAFFLAPPPATPDIPDTIDFRGNTEGELPANLLTEIRRAEAHRDALINLAGVPADRLTVGAINWNTVELRAQEFRAELGLTSTFRPAESQRGAIFNFWRSLIEERGYLVFQTTGISLNTYRGLSLHHENTPIILINGADSPNGRIFTLFHEIAHLANGTSGLCALKQNIDAEALCNAFAANFLMPSNAVQELLRNEPLDGRVEALAARFKVSILAAGVRLKTLGYINDEELQEIRRSSDSQWEHARQQQRKKEGFVPTWQLRYRDLGPTYLSTVFHALESDQVNYIDAAYMLNARVPTILKMQEEFHRRGGR